MTIDSHLTRTPPHKFLINIYNQNRRGGGGGGGEEGGGVRGPFDKYAVSIAY